MVPFVTLPRSLPSVPACLLAGDACAPACADAVLDLQRRPEMLRAAGMIDQVAEWLLAPQAQGIFHTRTERGKAHARGGEAPRVGGLAVEPGLQVEHR